MAKNELKPFYISEVGTDGVNVPSGESLGGNMGQYVPEIALNAPNATIADLRRLFPAEIRVGTGTNMFEVDNNGLWLGSTKWSTAPFRVSMAGAATASTLTLTGSSSVDFALVTGATKPSDNATVGATSGTDLKDSGAVVLSDIHIKNIKTVTFKESVTSGNAISLSDGNSVADNPQNIWTNAGNDSVTSTKYVAKKFTTTSAGTAIATVTFHLSNDAGATNAGNIIVSIRASDGTSPTGSDIDGRTVSVPYSILAFGNSDLLVGTFATPPAVSPSTEYFVVLTQDGGDSISIFSNAVASAGDRKSADTGASWSASTSNYQYNITPYETGMSSGEYRLSSAKDTDFRYSNFIGIALETKSANQAGRLLMIGVSDVQPSLTSGKIYYLGNTNGSITNPAGTNSKKIGIAFSTTELLLLNT
jgi:hypothetical protein